MILLSLVLGCSGKGNVDQAVPAVQIDNGTGDLSAEGPPPAVGPTGSDGPRKPPLPLQNNTEKLVKEGMLTPVPEEIALGDGVEIQFRTLYPNGCWRQTEVETSIEGRTILHSYESIYEGEGRMCTMGFKPGGFTASVEPEESGEFTGRILLNGEERAAYVFRVIAP
jgi:hypothetical protein